MKHVQEMFGIINSSFTLREGKNGRSSRIRHEYVAAMMLWMPCKCVHYAEFTIRIRKHEFSLPANGKLTQQTEEDKKPEKCQMKSDLIKQKELEIKDLL